VRNEPTESLPAAAELGKGFSCGFGGFSRILQGMTIISLMRDRVKLGKNLCQRKGFLLNLVG
jgi:hypothetical protein